MRLAIVGSRSFEENEDNYILMTNAIRDIFETGIDLIISGGASGADKLGKLFAEQNNLPYKEFLPNWQERGKIAGLERNTQIVDACDILIAFWDLVSRGTKDSINKALKSGKPVIIIPI